jgi:hypothetical protein
MGVLTTDGQFHALWNTEVTWGLENDVTGLRGTVAGVEEGEVSESVLIGGEGVVR